MPSGTRCANHVAQEPVGETGHNHAEGQHPDREPRVRRVDEVDRPREPTAYGPGGQHDGEHGRHPHREAGEGEAEPKEGERVGQVRDGQQERGGVGHPEAGIGAGLVRYGAP
jgi:hypothetical protein